MTFRTLAGMALLLCQASALAVQDFTVTREDLTMMPRYCTAIYGKLVGLPEAQISALQYTIPSDCPAPHHYCDGLKAMVRATTNLTEGKYWLSVAVKTFQYQVGDWESRGLSCHLRPELYTNLGNSLFRQNKTSVGLAIQNFNKALDLQKDYLPAYFALSDVYLELGEKKDALEAVAQGLKYVPDSKGLLSRFKELGGKTPPPPIGLDKPPAGAEPDKTAEQQAAEHAAETPQSAVSGDTSEHAASLTGSTTEEATVSPATGHPPSSPENKTIGTPANPYCRFCPTE